MEAGGTNGIRREALGLLELTEIHAGLPVIDAMLKQAPVEVLAATAIPPGRFLIVVVGGVAEVEAAWRRGGERAEGIHDRLFLPDVAPAVLAALRPDLKARPVDALGLFETTSVAAAFDAADHAVKGADVVLESLHVARGIRGRCFALVSGRQDMVEAALVLARERGEHHAQWAGCSIVPNPDPVLARRLLAEPWGFLEGQEVL